MNLHKPMGIVGRFVLNPTFRSLVPEKWDRISVLKTGSPVSGINGRNLYTWYAWRCLFRVVLLRLRSWCFRLGVALFGEGAPACEFTHVRFLVDAPVGRCGCQSRIASYGVRCFVARRYRGVRFGGAVPVSVSGRTDVFVARARSLTFKRFLDARWSQRQQP